jgi:GT2 family glycosyltransferase
MLDIVIGTAGRFDMLEKCLDAVYREAQTNAVHVILMDDGSPMQEKVVNQHLFVYNPEKDPAGKMTWDTKRIPENMGYPFHANMGAKMGKAPLIMFLSDDVEMQPGVVDRVLRDFDDTEIGIVGIKLLFPPYSMSPIRPAGKVQHVGVDLNIHADPIHPLVGWNADDPKCCVTRKDAFAVTGACLTVRRSLFEKVGGFDMAFGKGTYEDMDLCLKVRAEKRNIMIDAEAIAWHYAGATIEKRQEAYNLGQNNAIWKTRWMNSGFLVWGEHRYW